MNKKQYRSAICRAEKAEIPNPDATPFAVSSLTVTITPTADGRKTYMQVMSGDQFSINVVLVADRIDVRDTRPKP